MHAIVLVRSTKLPCYTAILSGVCSAKYSTESMTLDIFNSQLAVVINLVIISITVTATLVICILIKYFGSELTWYFHNQHRDVYKLCHIIISNNNW